MTREKDVTYIDHERGGAVPVVVQVLHGGTKSVGDLHTRAHRTKAIKRVGSITAKIKAK